MWNIRMGMIGCRPADCRKVEVTGARCNGRKRKTWYECVEDDMKALGLHPEWAVFRDMWRGFISGRTT